MFGAVRSDACRAFFVPAPCPVIYSPYSLSLTFSRCTFHPLPFTPSSRFSSVQFNYKLKLKTRTLAEASPKSLRSLSETLRLTSLLKSLKNNLLPVSPSG